MSPSHETRGYKLQINYKLQITPKRFRPFSAKIIQYALRMVRWSFFYCDNGSQISESTNNKGPIVFLMLDIDGFVQG